MDTGIGPAGCEKNVVNRDIICAISQNQSTSETNFWIDMTGYKDLKGSGGIVGITNQKSALVRWTLTRYFLASFSSAMNGRAGITYPSI
jgi:hypothetical protein